MTSTINFSTSYGNKGTGANQSNTLTAKEWNGLMSDLNTMVGEIPTSSGSSSSSDSHVVFDSTDKHNLTIQTTAEDQYQDGNKLKGGKINIEPISDLLIKPGDDISLCSHHRKDPTEVSMKVLDGNDNPVKLQLNAANIVLTTKDKSKTKEKDANGDDTSTALYDDPNVMNITVNSAKNTRGYLKVRAQAIDLRCEEHGGIALQPKGEDSDGNMNKIKFEHGGGDGLEFGTFNTEKASIFTDEYRFNREGVWKMATREKLDNSSDLEGTVGVTIGNKKYVSGKSDETQHYSYKKQADDFYDVIALDDEQCTTKDIIKTAYAMNGGKDRHTKITKKGAVEIATNVTWTIHIVEDNGSAVNINTISDEIAALDSVSEGMAFNDGDFKVGSTSYTPNTTSVYTNGTQYFKFVEVAAPAIKIDSGSELKLGGILDFGSSFNFGETDNGIGVQYKLTKQNNTKDCGILKVIGINNSTTKTLTITTANPSDGTVQDYIIPTAFNTYTPLAIASCSINDIIMFVNWAKGTGYGPWSSEAIANKEELYWDGSGFSATVQGTPSENPTVG